MSKHRRRPFLSVLLPLSALLVGGAGMVSSAVLADAVGEGRPTAPVPVGQNITQVAPAGDTGGFVYERARIKRTVPLDPTGGLENRWDALYSVQDTTGGNESGRRTAYLDWDDDYLYLAVEAPAPEQVRFDLDLADDGWLRGADNLSLVVTPPSDGGADPPKLEAQRFDMAQNKDQPVWAASPIPAGEIKVRGGRTPSGGYAVTLAVPRTEVMGFARKAGQGLGVRVDAAAPTLPSAANETAAIPVRPMLRVALADAVEATGEGLTLKVSVDGKRDITPGGEVRATIEVKNNSANVKRLSRLYLRGSLAGADYLDEQKFAGTDIEPGKTYKKSLRSTLAPAAPFGALVLRGGADVDGIGATLAALAAFEKVEPYILTLDVDDRPVPAGGENNTDARRIARVTLRSRVNTRTTGQVKLVLPDGWKLESGGTLERSITLTRDGQEGVGEYKFIVPHTARLGPHPIGVTAQIGGRTYQASDTVTLIP